LNGFDLVALVRALAKRQFVKSITRQSLVDTIPLLSFMVDRFSTGFFAWFC